MDLNLARKYNVPAPRYTSYPTAVQFQEVHEQRTVDQVRQSLGQLCRPLSLYVHIPFCFSLCWYCGCTKVITRDQDRGDHYLDDLEKEMDLVMKSLNSDAEVIQLHFGGGTPTFLKPEQLRRLGESLQSRFNFADELEFSVEIDPRRCDRERIEALREIGCNRASLGVQDTNPDVQKAIHRIQPFAQTAEVTHLLREIGIHSVNFDLIYGLPRQTLKTFSRTLDDVLTLSPDRLAIYSYAHLPDRMPSQRLLNEDEFPSTEDKLQMIARAVNKLQEEEMRFIGMDHFARKEDGLSKALDEGTLQRNFQGYSTCADTDMIALGMSGISQLEHVYYQNTKDLGVYSDCLENQRLPIVKKLELTRDDRVRKDLIMQIMCRRSLDFEEFSSRWDLDAESYFRNELRELESFEIEGLINRQKNGFMITDSGRFFLRNIAMVFDFWLQRESRPATYSKSV